jgi:hypothetical protein
VRGVVEANVRIQDKWFAWGENIPTLGKFGVGPAGGNGEYTVIKDLANGLLMSTGPNLETLNRRAKEEEKKTQNIGCYQTCNKYFLYSKTRYIAQPPPKINS